MFLRLLSNRIAAKRSYYRRQNRQTNIKQAIDQIQGELKTARSKVAIFRQLLREAGLDPDAIMANANVSAAAAVAANSLPSRIPQVSQQQRLVLQQQQQQQQQLQQQQHSQQHSQQQQQQQAAAAGMVPKRQGDGGNVTPPNTLNMTDQAGAHMISPLLVGLRDAST